MGSIPSGYTAECIKRAFAAAAGRSRRRGVEEEKNENQKYQKIHMDDIQGTDRREEDDEYGVPLAVVMRRNAFRSGGQSVGFALITFRSPEQAARAHACLDGTPLPRDGASCTGAAAAPAPNGAGNVFYLRRFAETLRTAVPDRPTERPTADYAEVTLASQLAPLSTSELRRRLVLLGCPADPVRHSTPMYALIITF